MAPRRPSIPFPDDFPNDQSYEDQFAYHDQMVRGALSNASNPADALLASPWSSRTITTLSRYLTDWYFWRKMFTDVNSDHEQVFKDIFTGQNAGKKIIAMVGFRGSGKSTLIRWLSVEAKCPILVFDFLDTPGFRLEDFTEDSLTEQDIIRAAFGKKILELLRWDRDQNQWAITKIIRSMWSGADAVAVLGAYINKPALTNAKTQLSSIENWASNDSNEHHLTDLFQSIISLPAELILLFALFMLLHDETLFDMPKRVVDEKEIPRQVFVALDNLDALIEDSLDNYNHEIVVTRLFKTVLNAFAATLLLVSNFAENWQDDDLHKRWEQIRFILTERRTTWQMSKTDHAEMMNDLTFVLDRFGDDPARDANNQGNLPPLTHGTTVFPLEEIISARVKYFKEDKVTANCDAARLAVFLECVLRDPALRRHLRPLFNYNIRAATEKLGETRLEPDERDKIQELLAKTNTASFGDQGVRTLVRGWVIGSTCESFVERGYLSTALSRSRCITAIDRQGRTLSANKGRLILTFLHGKTKPAAAKADPPLEEAVTGSELCEAFSGLFTAAELATLLWELYCRRTAHSRDRWSRLIEFVGPWGVGHSKLQDGMASTPEQVGVRITFAGITYLEFLATHFELMNVQETKERNETWRPLYSLVGDPDWETRAKTEIAPVVERARKCCLDLAVFNEQVFVIPRFAGGWKAFRDSNYTLKVKGSSWDQDDPDQGGLIAMTHAERLVFSHLAYLDSVRLAMIRTCDPMSAEGSLINRVFLGFEKDYLDMLWPLGPEDSSCNILANELDECIKWVVSSDYQDCRTPVDSTIGKILKKLPLGHMSSPPARLHAAASAKAKAEADKDVATHNWILDFEAGRLG